jgi:hypothetical protein
VHFLAPLVLSDGHEVLQTLSWRRTERQVRAKPVAPGRLWVG